MLNLRLASSVCDLFNKQARSRRSPLSINPVLFSLDNPKPGQLFSIASSVFSGPADRLMTQRIRIRSTRGAFLRPRSPAIEQKKTSPKAGFKSIDLIAGIFSARFLYVPARFSNVLLHHRSDRD